MKTALLKGKNRWLLAAVLVIAAAAVFIGYRMIRLRRNAQAVREAMNTVETVRAVRQNLIESISVTGTIASADARDVSASAKDVKVLQVNYEEGDYVNAGDVIVVLDSSDLERSLSQARNSQALSEYKENKSIETDRQKSDPQHLGLPSAHDPDGFRCKRVGFWGGGTGVYEPPLVRQ